MDNEIVTTNFIHEMVANDIKEGGRYYGKRFTQDFPPNPTDICT